MTQLNAQQALSQAERFLALGNYPQAIGISSQLAQRLPDQPASRILHGTVLSRFERYKAALEQFDAGYEVLGRVDAGGDAAVTDAVQRNTKTLAFEHAKALAAMGRGEEALVVVEKAGGPGADPRLIAARLDALASVGRSEDAGREASAAIGDEEVTPEVVVSALRVELGHPGAVGSGELAKVATEVSRRVGIRAALLVDMLRLLGDLLDREGQADEAWTAFRRAATITHQPFDTRAFLGEIGRLTKNWSADACAKPTPSKVDASRAVMVVGLPTRLHRAVSDAVAMHPGVSSAGRIDMLREVCIRFMASPTDRQIFVPDQPGKLRGSDLEKSGKHYVRRLEERVLDAGAERWLDTQPVNGWYLPAIALAMRGVRVVRVVESPAASALDLFAHASVFDHPYADDLASCAAASAAYARLNTHWDAVLADERTPDLAVHTVTGEAIDADPEGTLRAIFEFCGVDANADDGQSAGEAAKAVGRARLDPAKYDRHLGEAKAVLTQLGA